MRDVLDVTHVTRTLKKLLYRDNLKIMKYMAKALFNGRMILGMKETLLEICAMVVVYTLTRGSNAHTLAGGCPAPNTVSEQSTIRDHSRTRTTENGLPLVTFFNPTNILNANIVDDNLKVFFLNFLPVKLVETLTRPTLAAFIICLYNFL